MSKALQLLRGSLLTAPWLAHLLAADLLLSLLLPVSAVNAKVAYDAASWLAWSVWSGIQLIFTKANGAKITVSGDALPRSESAIVVANHVGWVDFYMIQALAIRAQMLGRSRWFAKRELRWVPFLGWGLWAMGMPMVTRNWAQDRAELDSIFGRIVRNRLPIWLISYSEATRFTARKHAQAVEWCAANGRPSPQHTLWPRTRGFVAQVQQLRHSHVRAVYDCTISYAGGRGPAAAFHAPPSMWDTLSRGQGAAQFHVHVKRFLLDDLPAGDAELAAWLEARWVAKGRLLEAWRAKLARSGVLGGGDGID